LAPDDQRIELPQRVAPVGAFKIVFGPEQTLPAGLALPARDGAEGVETARDRAEEALLCFYVGRNGSEQGRLRLVSAVGASEPLDRGVRLPAWFKQVVDAEAAISRRQLGMIAAPGAARIAEDEDPLLIVHEGGGFGEVGRTSAVFDHELVAF